MGRHATDKHCQDVPERKQLRATGDGRRDSRASRCEQKTSLVAPPHSKLMVNAKKPTLGRSNRRRAGARRQQHNPLVAAMILLQLARAPILLIEQVELAKKRGRRFQRQFYKDMAAAEATGSTAEVQRVFAALEAADKERITVNIHEVTVEDKGPDRTEEIIVVDVTEARPPLKQK
eukprot:c16579_g1_i1.p1 GENE.c16579_g1_i1~~c16579_g1_i1.p1  ORF type:complete len:176 (-),score=32.72 c16579_g1_i1:749-1276(-)